MKFGAVSILATEDKRTIRGLDRKSYVIAMAEALYQWVTNGEPDNGSADSFQCDVCGQIESGGAYEWVMDGELLFGCKRCFSVQALEA